MPAAGDVTTMSTLTSAPCADRAAPALVVFLAALAAVGQFASNVYIPSLPAVAVALDQPVAAVQLTLAVFLASFAVMQLVCGPLADRHGRRPVLIGGLVVFLLGTGVCLGAQDIGFLIAGRTIQAAGAAAAFVVSRAISRDLFEGAALAKTMALVSMVFALVPGLTPLLGGVLQEAGGWRLPFAATLVFGACVLVAALPLGETNRAPLARIDGRALGAAYASVLRTPQFRRYALSSALVFAGLSAFFAGSPDVYIARLGVSPIEYGLYPPLTITGFVLGGLVTRRLAGRIPEPALAGFGLALIVLASGAMLALPAAGILHKYALTAAMGVFVTGLGVFLPTAVAAALMPFPRMAGSAAAMLGFLQMADGALGTVAVSVLTASMPLLAFPLVMLAAGLLAAAWFAGSRTDSRSPSC
jgi:MFS transporter, DHA1 family, multidrug resistance protein